MKFFDFFERRPFTPENLTSLSTILGAVAGCVGVSTTIHSQDPKVQIVFYALSIFLIMLKDSKVKKLQ